MPPATSLALRHPSHFIRDAPDLKACPPRHTVSPSLCSEGPLPPLPFHQLPHDSRSLVRPQALALSPEGNISLNLLNVQLLSNQVTSPSKMGKALSSPTYQPRFAALGAPSTGRRPRLLLLVKTCFPTYVTAGTAGHSEGCSSSPAATLWATRLGPQLCLD